MYSTCAEMGESSSICEVATNNGTMMDLPNNCKVIIDSLVREAESYAKQNEEDSIWRLIEKIECKTKQLPTTNTLALRRKWSEELYHKAECFICYNNENNSSDREEINEFNEHSELENEEIYYSRRWTNVMKQSGQHTTLVIEPRSGLHSYASFVAHPQQPIDISPPPHPNSLISLLSQFSPSLNGKHFLNCFILTAKKNNNKP